jgi:hypothetical protein
MQSAWLVGGLVALALVQHAAAFKILVAPGKTECISQSFNDDAFQVMIHAPAGPGAAGRRPQPPPPLASARRCPGEPEWRVPSS